MDKQPFRAGFPDRLKLAEQGTLIGIGQEQHELISPKPCERRWVGELLPRELCGFPQNHIPGGVSERTVDALDASTSMDASPFPAFSCTRRSPPTAPCGSGGGFKGP